MCALRENTVCELNYCAGEIITVLQRIGSFICICVSRISYCYSLCRCWWYNVPESQWR